jgi:hypothetical protein
MDRNIVYAGQIPLETDILSTNKNAMIGVAKLAAALMGTNTIVNGFACTPTSPASMQVYVTAGEIYSLQNIDDTAFSSLAADTAHQILKQGILLDKITLNCPAPVTAGQSINYLVQVAFAEVDSNSVTLPYYNSSNPSVAWTGPANNGTSQPTVRKDTAVVTVKAGTAATTGSQVTPTADSGNIGLYVVTVAAGASSITASNIASYVGASRIPTSGIAASVVNSYYSKNVAGGSDVTLSVQESANAILSFAGALTANINVILPASSGQWIVNNSTNGSFNLVVKTPSGTGVIVPQGGQILIYCDGINILSTSNKLATATWSIEEASGALYFKVNGVAKAKLDSSGNLTVAGSVEGGGTI